MVDTPEQVALVTGAGRGIGRASALSLADAGFTIVLTARTAAQIDEAAAEIAASGGTGVAIPGDITDGAFVERLFATIRDRFGRLDVLVNNAGAGHFGSAFDLDVADFRADLELNVVAAFACAQQAIRIMRDTGNRGKVINVGSVRSHWTEGGDAGAYNASKYALRGMTESIARELHGSGSGIAVGLICPGIVDTPLTNPDGEPRPDWLVPEDIARAVVHAATAPEGVNVFDTIVIPLSQRPW